MASSASSTSYLVVPRWRRFMGKIYLIGYHHLLMISIAMSCILASVLLAGCSPNSGMLRNIYILGISAHESTGPGSIDYKAVRSGYFGVCSFSENLQWICTSASPNYFTNIGASDLHEVAKIGSHFTNNVIFPGLLIASVALQLLGFSGLATLPGWTEERDDRTGSMIDIKPFPSRLMTRAVSVALDLAVVLLLISAVWQHVAAVSASSTITSTTHGQVTTHVGAWAVALVWLSFVLALVPALGVEVMITSIKLLDELTD